MQLHFTTRVRYGFLSVQLNYTIRHADKQCPKNNYNGIYEILLAMKYMRPSDDCWMDFYKSLCKLIEEYENIIDVAAINFPEDWQSHLVILGNDC